MTTLIAVYNSDGLVGRCNARCHDATCPECDCVCGGMNHGKGRKKASENTARCAELITDMWKREDPESKIEIAELQMSMF